MQIVLILLAALTASSLAAPALAADAAPVSLESLLQVLIPAVLTPLAMLATEQLKVWLPRLLAYKVARLVAPGVLYAAAVWVGTLAEVYTLPGWLNLVIAPIPNLLYTALRASGWEPPSKRPPTGSGAATLPAILLAVLVGAGLWATPAMAEPTAAHRFVDWTYEGMPVEGFYLYWAPESENPRVYSDARRAKIPGPDVRTIAVLAIAPGAGGRTCFRMTAYIGAVESIACSPEACGNVGVDTVLTVTTRE